MSRILFFLGIFIVIAVAWSISRRKSSQAIGEPMEKCDECGVYFPRRDAVRSGEGVYCSERCRDAAKRR